MEKKQMEKAREVIKAYRGKDNMYTDPNGSYSGKPADVKDKPVQDADDL